MCGTEWTLIRYVVFLHALFHGFSVHLMHGLTLVYIYIYIYICNVYMGSQRAIPNNIAPKPRFFSSKAKIFPRARPAARGNFLTEDEKNRGWGGYIVGYGQTRPHIYNIYTTFGGYVQVSALIQSIVINIVLVVQSVKFNYCFPLDMGSIPRGGIFEGR